MNPSCQSKFKEKCTITALVIVYPPDSDQKIYHVRVENAICGSPKGPVEIFILIFSKEKRFSEVDRGGLVHSKPLRSNRTIKQGERYYLFP